MRVALLALILVAVIVILPALAARRSRVGQRLVRDHHRALDTLGHIASTSPENPAEPTRSGFTTIGPSGLPTDATGPQAHVKVVSPNTPALPAPRPITGGWRPTRATGAAPFRRPEPRPGLGEGGADDGIPGTVDAGGPWDRVRPVTEAELEAARDEAEPEETAPVPPLPDRYHAAGVRADGGEPAPEDDAELATPAEGVPAVSASPPAPPVDGPDEVSDEEVSGVPTGRHTLVPDLPWLPPLPVDEDDESPWRPPAGPEEESFPGADPAVPAWATPAAGPSRWRSTSPLAPPSARDDDLPASELADDEPPTQPVDAVGGEATGPAPADPAAKAERAVWRPSPPVAEESGSLASRRPPIEPRGRRHKKTAPRGSRAKRSHKGRYVGTAAALVIVLAGGGYVGYRELDKPASKGQATSATTVPSTTPTTSAPSSTTTTTTAPTVTVPYKLISSTADTAVYQVTSGAHITVTAVGTCWVEIKQTNDAGADIFEETMTAGSNHVFSGPAWIRIGDPAQVTITINGKKITPPASGGAPVDIQFQ